MTARVSRADLLQCLERQGVDELNSILDCFGYKPPDTIWQRSDRPDPEPPKQPELPPEPPPEPPKPPLESLRPAEVFYRVEGSQPSSLLPEPQQSGQPDMPEWVKSIDYQPLDLNNADWCSAEAPAPHQPLVAWSELWPLLRRELSHTQTRKRPDIPELVKLTAKAEQLKKIPQQQRRYWTARVIVLMDRPRRLNGLNQDYLFVEQQLVKQRGDTGVESWFVLDLARRKMLCGEDEKDWHNPDPETPVLILSDLGVYDKSGEATRNWLAFGQSLNQAGCQVFVLVPAPVRYLSDELTRCFRCISWDRYSSLSFVTPTGLTQQAVKQQMHDDQCAADDLLAMCSMAVEIEPALLRGLRYQFAAKHWDIGHELLVWNHKQLTPGSNVLGVDADVQEAYRNRLAQLLGHYPELAEPLYRYIRQQLADMFTLDYVDALCFTGLLAGIKDDVLLSEAEQYLKQYVLATHQHRDHRGLLFGGQQLLARQSRQSLEQKDYLSSLWGILKSRSGNDVARPDYLKHTEANVFLSGLTVPRQLQLIQWGEWCYLGSREALAELQVPGFAVQPYVLAEVSATQDLVIEEYQGVLTDHILEKEAYLRWPLSGSERVLHVGGRRLVVEAVSKPVWVEEVVCGEEGFKDPVIVPTGEDEFGTYFDLVLPDEVIEKALNPSISFYITHSSADKYLVLQLTEILKSRGYKVWSDSELTIGSNWNSITQKAMMGSSYIILVWSKSSVQSEWVQDESRFAYERNLKILPIVIDDVEIQYPFNLVQSHDLKQWDGDASDKRIKRMVADIDSLATYELSKQRFRYIPPQIFMMGSPEDEPERMDSETQHQVTLTKGYWLADTTVTQAFWQAMAGENPSHFKGDNRPVEKVSWEDAQRFIQKLNNEFPLLTVDLPTEAEWECACRAGTTTPFSFGENVTPDQVNYDGNYPYNGADEGEYRQQTVEVKSLPPNPWGLYEMHGNVWEWCQDGWLAKLPASPVADPLNASEEQGQRVVRGGSWDFHGRNCRPASRVRRSRGDRYVNLGVRLALRSAKSAEPQEQVTIQQADSHTGQVRE